MANSKFHHEEIYRGADLVKKLGAIHITVCGCGALGSNLIESLARQGFSKIRTIDMDRVETHNLGTQIFEQGDCGAMKVAACRNLIFKAVGLEIETFDKELTGANIKKFLKGTDFVVDAFDNSASRKLLYDYCKEQKITCLHCGMADDGVYGEVIWNDKYRIPKDTEGDVCDYPLARNLVCLVTCVAAEEIIDFCLSSKPRLTNWSITLKDLAVRPFT